MIQHNGPAALPTPCFSLRCLGQECRGNHSAPSRLECCANPGLAFQRILGFGSTRSLCLDLHGSSCRQCFCPSLLYSVPSLSACLGLLHFSCVLIGADQYRVSKFVLVGLDLFLFQCLELIVGWQTVAISGASQKHFHHDRFGFFGDVIFVRNSGG